MDVINEIIQNSALGLLSKWYKSIVLLLFSAIVSVLLTMLIILVVNGPDMIIRFGY